MHEFSVTSSIIDILKKTAKEKNISKIFKVNFLLSPLGGIEPDSIKFYFDFFTKKDDLLKGAELFFERGLFEYSCNNCGYVFKEPSMVAECKKCGSHSLNIIDSDEIKIMTIDI